MAIHLGNTYRSADDKHRAQEVTSEPCLFCNRLCCVGSNESNDQPIKNPVRQKKDGTKRTGIHNRVELAGLEPAHIKENVPTLMQLSCMKPNSTLHRYLVSF